MLSTQWTAAVGAYTTAMSAAGRARGTIGLHRHYLWTLAGQCPRPWSVTLEDLQAILASAGWAPETRKSARTVFRGFYRWAHRTGRVEVDPAAELSPVYVPPASARPAPELVLAMVLRHHDERVRLAGMLAAYCGLRAGEIARVHADDLDGDRLRVHGKGSRTRVVPVVHGQLLDRLALVDGYAFPGRAGAGGHITSGTITRLLSRAMPDGWTAHTLRHRCATVAYAGSRDLLAVGAVLGHARPETTRRYVQLPDDSLRAALAYAAA